CDLKEGTIAQKAYGVLKVSERHRHRYEFNNAYLSRFEKAGMKVSGVYSEEGLVEIMELSDHPWFLATQFHPEFRSRPTGAHPIFRDFIQAALGVKAKTVRDHGKKDNV
ncbi:MAG TPA: hypothetical protein VLB09_09640, partial [Nitrospiria bacterium]|nr:hypothetical protein [Nitrospiria bacterium]